MRNQKSVMKVYSIKKLVNSDLLFKKMITIDYLGFSAANLSNCFLHKISFSVLLKYINLILSLVVFNVHAIKEVIGVIPVPAASKISFVRFFSTTLLNDPRGQLIINLSPTLVEHNLRLSLPSLYSLTRKYKVGSSKIRLEFLIKNETGVYDRQTSTSVK